VESFVDETGNAKARRMNSSKHRHARWLVVLVMLSSAALAACGGPGSPNVANNGAATTTTSTGNGVADSSSALPFSRCMRTQGVSNYPDPSSSGAIPKESPEQLGVSNSKLQSASHACAHLLPNGGAGPNQSQIEQEKALGLKFAQCMRSHGVGLPDPGSNGRIPDPASVGINQGSPKFQTANQACRRYRPPYMPSNSAYNAYVRSPGS
jgi:hypothetical protein